MAGTDGTPITNPTATETPSNYEVCQRTGFREEAGKVIREWTGLFVRPGSWEKRHPGELQRGQDRERAHSPGNPEPDDVFISTAVSAVDL